MKEPSSEIEPIIISALNEYVFCPRRCALKFVEGWWGDNEHTALGTLLHDHADAPGYEMDEGVKLLRGLPLFSRRYGITGKADIVEVRGNVELRIADGESKEQEGRENGGLGIADCELKETATVADFIESAMGDSPSEVTSAPNSTQSAIRNPRSEIRYAPVEYKKGRRRKFENDDIQLCAQAFCLEEMFSTTVPEGFIYHAASKRRRRVVFDERLRLETEETIHAVRQLIAEGEVPPAVLKPRCDGCSLRSVCMPELTGERVPNSYKRSARELWQDG